MRVRTRLYGFKPDAHAIALGQLVHGSLLLVDRDDVGEHHARVHVIHDAPAVQRVLNQIPPNTRAGSQLADAADDVERLAGAGDCDVETSYVGEEPYAAVGAASHGAEDDDIALLALVPVDGVDLDP